MLETLRRTIGAVFTLKNVEGLPRISGLPESLHERISKIPPSFLLNEATELLRSLRSPGTEADLMEDSLSEWVIRFLQGGWKGMKEGLPLEKALAYVRIGIKRQYINAWKANHQSRRALKFDARGYEPKELLQYPKCKFPQKFEEVRGTLYIEPTEIPVWAQEKAVAKLAEIHPEMPNFFKKHAEGYTVVEIVRGFKKPMSVQNWHQRVCPKLVGVIEADELAA